VCEILLKSGAKIDAITTDGMQPMHLACRRYHKESVKVLLSHGINVNEVNKSGFTPLHIASNGPKDSPEICELLLQFDAKIDALTEDGSQPLHLAFRNCHRKTGELLLSYGADANAVNQAGQTPLYWAVNAYPGWLEMFEMFVEHTKSVGGPSLESHDGTIRNLIELKNASYEVLEKLIILSVKQGSSIICRELLECGVPVDTKVLGDRTLLSLAITGDKHDIARLLLEHGADLEKVNIRGRSAVERSRTTGTRKLASLVQAADLYPEEIVSQGEAALKIYLRSCDEGTAVTVFIRVDVVGRDGAGKTSLTKSLTLQRFNPNELSTRGIVFDPNCQIIVEEACNWTCRLTSEHYTDIYDRNVTTSVAQALDTRSVRSEYFSLKETERPARKRKQRNFKVNQVLDVTRSIESPGGRPKTVAQQDASDDLQLQSAEPASVAVSTSLIHSEQVAPNLVSQSDPSTTGDDNQVIPDTSAVTLDALDADNTMQLDAQYTSPHVVSQQSDCTTSVPPIFPDPYTENGSSKTIFEDSITDGCIPKRNANGDPANGQSMTTVIDSGPAIELLPSDVDCSNHKDSDNPPAAKRAHVEAIGTDSSIQKNTVFQPSVLPANIKQGVTGLLRNKPALRKAEKELFVTILDYAGQHVFYATHRLLMAKRSFYYVVYDASKPLEAKTVSIFRIQGEEIEIMDCYEDETNYDRLEEWIAAIHIMEDDDSRPTVVFEEQGILSPAMFLIGTHADELKKQPGLLDKQESYLKDRLEGTELCKHIVWASKERMCFYVDNTVTNPDTEFVDPEVRLLRQATEKLARQVAREHKLPIKWLKFEEEVRHLKEHNKTKRTASVEELQQIASRSAGIDEREDLEVLLRYLSNRAVLLYHPNALEKGRDEVVLDVEWLTLQLEKVITIRTEILPILQEDVKRSKEKGIVTEALIKHLLSDSGSAQILIISLMSSFDLLCPYSGIDAEDLDKADNRKDFIDIKNSEECLMPNATVDKCSDCFIPCLLEKKSPLESDVIPDCRKTMPLIFQSMCRIRMPLPLYYRLLTRLCKRFPRLPVLNRNVGYFHIYPGHRLELSLNRYSLKMIVLTKDDICPNTLVCSHLRQIVTRMVNDAKKEGMSGLKMHLGYHQADSSSSASVADCISPDFVSLEGYLDSRTELYHHCTGKEVSTPSEKLAMWYPTLKEKIGLSVCFPSGPSVCASSQRSSGYNLNSSSPVASLIKDPLHRGLLEVTQILDKKDVMGDDWRRLWTELLKRPIEEQLATECEIGPTLFTLMLWCRSKPQSVTTAGNLIKALNAIYRNDVAGILEKYITNTQEDSSGNSQGCDITGSSSIEPAAKRVRRDSCVTSLHVDIVVRCCSDKWKAMGRVLLSCDDTEVEDIVSGLPSPVIYSDKLRRIIETWQRRKGEEATVSQLVEACDHPDVKCRGDVERRMREKGLL
jgi:hypothetical protein